MRARLGRSVPPFPRNLRGFPPSRAERPFPKFLLNTHFREFWWCCGRAELTLPAALVHPGPPSIHHPGQTLQRPLGHSCCSRGWDTLRGEGRAVLSTLCWWPSKGRGSWRPAVPPQCHVGGCRRSGVALLSPSLAAPGPSPRSSRGLAAPRGSPSSDRSPGFCSEPSCPAPRPGRGVGVWVRGQSGRQSGMKDDFLNCISVRGLSGLMS